MRQPFEFGCSPDASSGAPAFASSSWYVAIAAMSFSSGMTPDSESFVAVTKIMNRIVVSADGLGSAQLRPDTSRGPMPRSH